MKKTALLISFFLITLNAHECKYEIEVDIDTQKNMLQGKAIITSDHPIMGLLDTKSNILEIKGAVLGTEKNITNLVKNDNKKDIEILFTHKFANIGEDVILLDNWYPRIDMMCKYETTILNSNIIPITEATKIEKEKNKTRYIFEHPLDKLNLVASKRYISNSAKINDGVNITTYFYPEEANISDRYLKKSQEYFKLYMDMFGFAPFERFSIVETPFPAGYSMPTYTLIGKQIIDKDYVLENSLGHEIAHQWFGNYVYAPYRGNWVEGMTTYYSDYLYAKNNNNAADYRKDMLIKYDSFVNLSNEITLAEFEQKSKESKNAVGYEKSAFFFYMLEQKIGKKAFDEGTKILLEKFGFKMATYEHLREIYEKTSGVKLDGFFKNWVYEKGALDFSINNINLSFVENRYILEFDIINNHKADYLPLSVCSDSECLETKIDLSKKQHRLELDIEPTKIIVDENYDIFRKLHTQEIPPVISKIIDANALAVIDRADEKKFEKFKKIFPNFRYADTIRYDEIKNNNLLILGAKNELLNKITLPFAMQGDAKIELFKNPLNEACVIAVFDMNELSKSIFFKLQHLGKYSTVVFSGEEVLQKSIKPSQKGVVLNIDATSYAMKPMPKKLNDIIGDIAKNRVVYIGENHTDFSSHLNQLKIIKAMYKNNPKLSIGMEMFQKQFQKYLDAYISGAISEKEMLQKTQYFKRWKYDYELYRPILLFAKEKSIPVIALNIDREITKKVVTGGFDTLGKDELAEIPNTINFDSPSYKEKLKEIYNMHQAERFKNFDEFYHAQLLWDESMASNLVGYLEKNPDYSMAVLAGNGHIMHGYGIPSRAQRRGIDQYTIVLNMSNPEPGIADYLLYPSNIDTQKAKKLGVFFKSDEDLNIEKFVEHSVAQKAQIKAGDRVIAFEGVEVKNIYDIKTELVFAKNSSILTIEREGKKIDFNIEFKQ